jgi:hypothetical protein
MIARGRKSPHKISLVTPSFTQPKKLDPPPSHLGTPEKRLWELVLDEFDVEGPVALALLTAALEAHERARLCREAITKEGLTVRGRDGPKPHPLLGPERAARQQLVACLRKLQVQL